MEKKRKILIISPFASPNIGGVETHLDKLMKEAIKSGYYIILITYEPLTTKTHWNKLSKGKGYEIHRVRWFGVGLFTKIESFFPLSFLYLFPGLFIKSLPYYLKNHKKISCIHSHGLAAATIARILSLIHKKRTVLSTHAVYNFEKREILNFIVKKILIGFDQILAVSKISRKELIKMGIPKSKIQVHKNWVDTKTFFPKNKRISRKLLEIPEGLNLLFVGRLIEIKGIKIILNASKKLENVTFHFVGNGPLKETIENQAKSSKKIVYHGILRQSNKQEFEKLLSLYSECDYLVSPYLYDEGFSATLIESVCCGTPVIVSNRGSPPTFLNKEVSVLLSKMPTAPELAKIINNSKQNGYLTKNRSKICREFGVKNFGPKNAKVILNSYEKSK